MSEWGPWYRVVKTLRGKQYVYDQTTRREGKHIRTLNRYIGPVGGAQIRLSYVGRGGSGAAPQLTTTDHASDQGKTRLDADAIASLGVAVQRVLRDPDIDGFTYNELERALDFARSGDQQAALEVLDRCGRQAANGAVREQIDAIAAELRDRLRARERARPGNRDVPGGTRRAARSWLEPGAEVRIAEGTGVDSGKLARVVGPDEVATDGRGVPTNVEGAYKPVDWSRDVAVRLADGRLIIVPKARLTSAAGGTTTGGPKPVRRSSPPAKAPRIMRAHDKPVIDAERERALIDAVFDPASKAERWQKPWKAGRYKADADWMPDERLHRLALKLGVGGLSTPSGGLVDYGWRRKRHEAKAALTYRNRAGSWRWMIEMPDHTRFKGNAHATAEQNYAQSFLHEIVHATALTAECRRPVNNRKGGEDYAREEGVADLAAHIVATRLGLAPASPANVAWYVDNWGKRMGWDKPVARAYIEREALKAADYLTKLWSELDTGSEAASGSQTTDADHGSAS